MSSSISEIHNKVEKFITNEIPINRGERLLLGVSGGADSVALLSILTSFGYNCVVAHCNFMLRGEESIRDRDFTRNLVKQFNVEYTEVEFKTEQYAKEKKLSIEMACRELRYNWFERERIKHNCRYVAIAHHRDDSIETLLINLIRGTGISGLTGISPVNGAIIRPLLSISRLEIELLLTAQNLPYIVDSTNNEVVYVRNKIRNTILPLMREINPSVNSSIERTIQNLRETEILYKRGLKDILSNIVTYNDDKTTIDISLLEVEETKNSLLYEILKPFGFISSQIPSIVNSINGSSGLRFFSKTHRIVKDREQFIVTPITTTDDITPIQTPEDILNIEYIDIKKDGFTLIRDRGIAYFDADKVEQPLTVRHWRDGDKFVPFGMTGRQKLSDYFTNRKYSLIEKEEAKLLVSDGEIIWIVGDRQSNKFKITNKTKRVLKLSLR